MLELTDINTFYGEAHILQNVSLRVEKGETVALLGRNGAGKTTTLRTIMGLTPAKKGQVVFNGLDITKLPTYIISRMGIGWVPDNRRIFPTSTVQMNLEIARRDDRHKEWDLEEIYKYFPTLEKLKNHKGEYLSGGELQMLSIARTLMGNPDLLLLDEPSEGLAPKIVREVMNVINELQKREHSILLVEQNSVLALAVSNRCYVMDKGRIIQQSSAEELDKDVELKKELLGI